MELTEQERQGYLNMLNSTNYVKVKPSQDGEEKVYNYSLEKYGEDHEPEGPMNYYLVGGELDAELLTQLAGNSKDCYFYDDTLENYIVPVYHWGTSWDHVETCITGYRELMAELHKK